MAAEEPKDKLAARIAARRLQDEQKRTGQPDAVPATVAPEIAPVLAAPVPLAVPASPAKPAAVSKPKKDANPDIEQKLAITREAIKASQNPMIIARLLGELVELGFRNKDLVVSLDMNKPWVSKKLALLTAPIKVQRLIEAGELPETDYHNNKNVTAQIKGRAATLEYRRMPTITISIETGKTLAAILRIVAAENGDTSISLLPNTSKKDIQTLLDLRAGSVLGMIE